MGYFVGAGAILWLPQWQLSNLENCRWNDTFQNESWCVSLGWYYIYLLFLAPVHGFMHETSGFFYSMITFSYTKYFVHSYTVDVVFTHAYEPQTTHSKGQKVRTVCVNSWLHVGNHKLKIDIGMIINAGFCCLSWAPFLCIVSHVVNKMWTFQRVQ